MRHRSLWSMVRWSVAAVPIALVLLLAAGCTASSASGEFGPLCWDGKDNDDDGAADCDDSECASLSICRRTQSRDLGSLRPDFGRVPDRGFPVDDAGPPVGDSTVDGPPPSGSAYGQPCQWRGSVTQCADGKTFCVLSPTSSSTGYCTYTCNNAPDDCPQPSDPQLSSRCLYRFNGVSVCTFMCKLSDLSWMCPGGLRCFALSGTQQSHCWL